MDDLTIAEAAEAPGSRRGGPAALARSFGLAETGLLVALGGMWGFSFLFIEIALRALGPLWIVAARTAVGGFFLLAVLRMRGKRLPSAPGMWRHFAALGILANALPWIGVAWAQQWLPSGLVALLMAAVPTSTLVVSVAFGLERFTRTRIAGLALALSGVGLTVAAEPAEPGRLAAIGVVIGATLMYALGAVYAKQFVSGSESPLTIATGQVLMAFVFTLPAALLLDRPPVVAGITVAVGGSVLALGAIGTGAAFLVFYTLIERVGATNTTLVTYLIPLVAVIAGALVLGERLSLPAIVGGGLIVAGVWLAQKGTRGRASGAPQRPTG